MRIAVLGMIAALAAAAAPAEPAFQGHEVSVCIESGSVYGIQAAKALAAKMFAAIGVTIRWHRGLRDCPPQGLAIRLSSRTPEDLMPGATAYALPFEGVHIQVFYDRIVEGHPQTLVQPLLAHVLVHEITHMLQGTSRHSASGVMKAHWDQRDFEWMAMQPLAFTREDVELIERGLLHRAAAAASLVAAR